MKLECHFNLKYARRVVYELGDILQRPWPHGHPEPTRFWDGRRGYYQTASGLGEYVFRVRGVRLVVEFEGRRNSLLDGTPDFRLLLPPGYSWNTDEAWLRLPTIVVRGEVVRWHTSQPYTPLGESRNEGVRGMQAQMAQRNGRVNVQVKGPPANRPYGLAVRVTCGPGLWQYLERSDIPRRRSLAPGSTMADYVSATLVPDSTPDAVIVQLPGEQFARLRNHTLARYVRENLP